MPLSAEGIDNSSAKLRSAVWDSRLEFLKAALHLFLSCHLLVWAEPKPCAAFLRHLHVLQVGVDRENPVTWLCPGPIPLQ